MKIVFKKLIFILIATALVAQTPQYNAKNGMVVSASELASQVGVDIMKAGGNAIDAAVATGFALAVTYPQAGNIGGGGFLVAHLANDRSISIDFRETAPKNAERDMFLDEQGEVIQSKSLRNYSASGVPGSVAGLLMAWKEFGSGEISLEQLIQPAIQYADNGFIISKGFANSLNHYKSLFEKDKGAAEIFIKHNGDLWEEGDLLVQKDLAKTLNRIAANGDNGFYTGETADLIVEEINLGDGLITLDDLKNYEPKMRKVLSGTYKDCEILSMGPPSSGGILLIQMLNMLETFNLEGSEHNSADYIHLLTEIERLAYADRAEHLGDSDYWDVPIEELISKEYAKKRADLISLENATPSIDVFAGQIRGKESIETTHYSVIDKDLNAVSVTTTINTSFGSGKLVDGAGFFLNNEMDDFSIKPGVPNVFGLVGNEANAIAPHKRPLSSMTPTIIIKDNKPYIIIGSPGGSTIITTVLQVLLNVLENDMDILEAVTAPRIHSQWLPDVIMIEENSISNAIKLNLENRGHTVEMYPYKKIGSANGILIDESGFWGGADPRRDNSAIGY